MPTVQKSPLSRNFMALCMITGGLMLGSTWPPGGWLADRTVPKETTNAIKLTSPRAKDTKLVVDLSDRQVQIVRNGKSIGRYTIAVGQTGWETPIGEFQIHQMRTDPDWQHPITHKVIPAGAPDNPLGDRWIGFHADEHMTLGFHGTPNETSIGRAVSHGCLRMRNDDIRKLYKEVGLGTIVRVQQ